MTWYSAYSSTAELHTRSLTLKYYALGISSLLDNCVDTQNVPTEITQLLGAKKKKYLSGWWFQEILAQSMFVLDEDSVHKPPTYLEAITEVRMQHVEPLQRRASAHSKHQQQLLVGVEEFTRTLLTSNFSWYGSHSGTRTWWLAGRRASPNSPVLPDVYIQHPLHTLGGKQHQIYKDCKAESWSPPGEHCVSNTNYISKMTYSFSPSDKGTCSHFLWHYWLEMLWQSPSPFADEYSCNWWWGAAWQTGSKNSWSETCCDETPSSVSVQSDGWVQAEGKVAAKTLEKARHKTRKAFRKVSTMIMQ